MNLIESLAYTGEAKADHSKFDKLVVEVKPSDHTYLGDYAYDAYVLLKDGTKIGIPLTSFDTPTYEAGVVDSPPEATFTMYAFRTEVKHVS